MELILGIVFIAGVYKVYSFLSSGVKKKGSEEIAFIDPNGQITTISETSKIPARRHIASIPESIYHWESTDYCEFEVVGESHYQTDIARLAGDHNDQGALKKYTAMLIPEDGNAYDNKAIRVEIEEFTVGNLSKIDARSFRRRLGTKKLSRQVTSCDAVVKGGHLMRNGKYASYGVSLAIKPFDDY
jgi:hypothetical protein